MLRKHIFESLRNFDWMLFAPAMVLVFFGLSGIGSVGLSKEPADFSALHKQIIFTVAGILIMSAVAFTHPTRWRFAGPAIYVVSLLSLLGVLIFGLTVRGTTGWFSIAGIRIQPVEAAKFALLIMLARFIAEHMQLSRQWKMFWRSGLILLPALVLVLTQPDVGSASVLVVLWFGLMFAAGIKRSHLAVMAATGALFLIFSWFFVLAPYQKDRILTFVDPGKDPLGSGYNVTQSIIAVGSGKFFGRGLGFGAQSQMKFLPEAQTDFIFAVLAEELGFAAVTLILFSFGTLFWRILNIAGRTNDPYTQLVAIGAFTIMFYETIVNVGMNIGLMPVTGITLPFISYGGSSLLSHFALLGLLQGVAMRVGKA